VDGEVTATNPADYNRKSYEYAHCVFGVQWVDWEAFNQFVVNAGDVAIPAASGGQGPKGIDQRHDNVERILRHWNNYLGAHPDALPVPEMLVLCEQRKAALAKRDCVTELSYWRSLSMLATLEKALKLKKQVILHGPPGTGKTFLAKQFVTKHWKLPAGRWEIVQFHPAYNYEDFVRGVQVSTNKQGQVEYLAVNRVFADMCRRAANDRDNDYVLIIDEINRANLAAVLGELIYALEYRGQPVRTPYKVLGGFDLEVPKNLYIIGTMNTADRSVGHIDYAVRRRFAFLPVLPNREVIQQFFAMDNGLRALADQLYGAVEKLFTCDDNKRKLTGDFFVDDVQPGHTYFLAKSCDELLTNFVYQVLPLLHEYVKDGVLQSDATLTLGDLNIPLSQPMNPELENQIRDWFHCFAPNAQPQQPGGQAAGADPAQNPAGVDDEPEEGDE
jgi:MoxR-like ATPase